MMGGNADQHRPTLLRLQCGHRILAFFIIDQRPNLLQ
jgi:hypothetical protein